MHVNVHFLSTHSTHQNESLACRILETQLLEVFDLRLARGMIQVSDLHLGSRPLILVRQDGCISHMACGKCWSIYTHLHPYHLKSINNQSLKSFKSINNKSLVYIGQSSKCVGWHWRADVPLQCQVQRARLGPRRLPYGKFGFSFQIENRLLVGFVSNVSKVVLVTFGWKHLSCCCLSMFHLWDYWTKTFHQLPSCKVAFSVLLSADRRPMVFLASWNLNKDVDVHRHHHRHHYHDPFDLHSLHS